MVGQSVKYHSVAKEEIHGLENTTHIKKKGFGKGKISPSFTNVLSYLGESSNLFKVPELKEASFQTKKILRIDPSGFMETEMRLSNPKEGSLWYRIEYPSNCICLLEIENPQGNIQLGTGFFVSPTCLLTAGRCVFNAPFQQWAKSVKVIPYAVGEKKPFGCQQSTQFKSVSGWIEDQDCLYELGAIILPDDMLFNRINSYLSFNVWESDKDIEIIGYPSDCTRIPYKTATGIQKGSPQKLIYQHSGEFATSGSPILTERHGKLCAVGIHINGGKRSSGIPFNRELINTINEWIQL